MEEIKYGQLWARHSELVSNRNVGEYRITFNGLTKAIEEALRSMQFQPNPGLPPLPEPILTNEDVKDWEGEKRKPGVVWVKCSLRMPEISTPPELITVKRYHDAAPDNYSARSMTAAQLVEFVKFDLATYEWLDESGTAAGRDIIQRIKDFNLSDIDAPVFTHTKEFAAHFSYIKGKLMDILKAEGTAAGREEDAVAFFKWADKKYYRFDDGWWTGPQEDGGKLITIEEMFLSFKQKEK